MDRIKLILIYVSVGLSFGLVRGQQIVNYIQNGSFEKIDSCYKWGRAKGWTLADTNMLHSQVHNVCKGNVPGHDPIWHYQMPRTGDGYASATLFCWTCVDHFNRLYFRNVLNAPLQANKAYCVKFFVNIANIGPAGIDAMGVVFADNTTLDTIRYGSIRITYLSPQVQNPTGNIIKDTANWTPITGTFVATGNETRMLFGNFKPDAAVNYTFVNYKAPWLLPGCEVHIDDFSCIPLDLPAFAGTDTTILVGDSVYIGRQADFSTDSICTWYDIQSALIKKGSGIWVKPPVTATYIVKQHLDCGPVKWDTVVVTVIKDFSGFEKFQQSVESIQIFPNPTSGNLRVAYSGSTDLDITSYVVINSFGQTVRDEFVHNIPVDINTSDLGPGLYEIQFRSRYGILTKKFVRTD